MNLLRSVACLERDELRALVELMDMDMAAFSALPTPELQRYRNAIVKFELASQAVATARRQE